MTEKKEFESLDELFRKTFDSLPETPAKSGWDTPSERVWQHVKEQIKPPQSGWSTQTLTLLAAFAVTLAVGLYLFLNRPVQPDTPAATPAPATAEAPERPSEMIQERSSDTQPAAPEAPAVQAVKAGKNKLRVGKKSDRYHNQEIAEAAYTHSADSSTEKPAEPKRKVPNTTLRLKAELAKRAEEAWKQPLERLPLRWPGKSKN